MERALAESSGNLSEAQLARDFGRGAPQSGAIQAAGRVAESNKQAFTSTGDAGGMNLTDKLARAISPVGLTAAGATGSYFSHNPAYLAAGLGAAVGRYGAQKATMSEAMQDMMTYLTPEQRRAALARAMQTGAISQAGN